MRRSEGEPPYRRLRSESDTIVIASEAWQSRGNEMSPARAPRRASPLARGGSPPRNPPQKKREQAYTNNLKNTRPRGLCAASAHLPARAPRPVAAHRREIPRGRNENKRIRIPQTLARAGSAPRQPTCPRWLTAEKSPAKETGTNVHVMRRSEGEPPYLTAAAHRRKKRFARFCRENRFSIYVIAFLRREPLISGSCGYTYSAFTAACFRAGSRFLSLPRRKFHVAPAITIPSCGYTYSAFTAACFRDRSRFLSFPKPFTSVPATAENRVVFYKTKKTG